MCVDAKNAQKVAFEGPTPDAVIVYEKRVSVEELLARAVRMLEKRTTTPVEGGSRA